MDDVDETDVFQKKVHKCETVLAFPDRTTASKDSYSKGSKDSYSKVSDSKSKFKRAEQRHH